MFFFEPFTAGLRQHPAIPLLPRLQKIRQARRTLPRGLLPTMLGHALSPTPSVVLYDDKFFEAADTFNYKTMIDGVHATFYMKYCRDEGIQLPPKKRLRYCRAHIHSFAYTLVAGNFSIQAAQVYYSWRRLLVASPLASMVNLFRKSPTSLSHRLVPLLVSFHPFLPLISSVDIIAE